MRDPVSVVRPGRIGRSVLPLLLPALLLAACSTPNKPWRTQPPAACASFDDSACAHTYVEQHFRAGASPERPAYDFDLSFFEFSERGNPYDGRIYDAALERLKQLSSGGRKTAIIVFVHGWKHNAGFDDGNVAEFRRSLELIYRSDLVHGRELQGVYVGWRGLSLHGLGGLLDNTTYWGRKPTAEEIGQGGVTELLLQLERISAAGDAQDQKNIFVVVGHSFGGAMVLSAVSEVLTERFHKALTKVQAGDAKAEIERFGDAVVLLNPAIEANEGLHLKALSHELGPFQDASDPDILQVISSPADVATKLWFPAGQFLGTVLRWDEEVITHSFGDSLLSFDEHDMDMATIGNFEPFRTDQLERLAQPAADIEGLPGTGAQIAWDIRSLCKPDVPVESGPAVHVPCRSTEPLSFLYTDDRFIGDHNDVFNTNVLAFLAASIQKSTQKRRGPGVVSRACRDAQNGFVFTPCFRAMQVRFSDLARERAQP